ncbi:MAG: hypothetical protein Q8P44_04455 [Dehalococcoidia bacterium]|nr:hypothetical protein [Dehalococcoidia bacterium]
MKKVTLCKDCSCCPVVEIYPDKAHIGEEGNLVVLGKDDWNTLVRKVKSGELDEIR